MGHILSRVFRRLTQSAGSSAPAAGANNKSQVQSSDTQSEDTRAANADANPLAGQSIPIGQSIDSTTTYHLDQQETNDDAPAAPAAAATPADEEQNNKENNNNNNMSSKQAEQVEEAVIKIQALVRGHLTRKALRDTRRNSPPPTHNALGQSQFDADSLTKNPPSAVFLPSSPLSAGASTTTAAAGTAVGEASALRTRADSQSSHPKTPLESIAEDSAESVQQQQQQQQQQPEERPRRPGALSSARADGLASPVPSEAQASIDLDSGAGGTCASASIDIGEPPAVSGNQLASVLYHKPAERAASPPIEESVEEEEVEAEAQEQAHTQQRASVLVQQPSSETSNDVAAVGGGHTSEEAAAIRIQSAFRGYRTRKHSPYRTSRSPSSPTPVAGGVQQNGCDAGATSRALGHALSSSALPEQHTDVAAAQSGPDACAAGQPNHLRGARPRLDLNSMDDDDDDDDDVHIQTNGGAALLSVRRQSRPTTRDASPSAAYDSGAGSDRAPSPEHTAAAAAAAATSASSMSACQLVEQQRQDFDSDASDALATTTSALASVAAASESVAAAAHVQAADSDAGEPESIVSVLEVASSSSAAPLAPPSLPQRASVDTDSSALGAVLSLSNEDAAALQQQPQLDEEEQRNIELESDDIERKDPSGDASARSPLIRAESPSYEGGAALLSQVDDELQQQDTLLKTPDAPETPLSGRSSAAASGDESDQNSSDGGNAKQAEEQKQAANNNNNKANKKRNRNRRKGKK